MSEAARGGRLALGPPRHSFIGSATYELWVCAPGVILQRVSGKADVDVAREIARQLEAAIAEFGPITLFDDFAGMTAYTSAGRFELTEWSKKHWAEMKSTHILVASKLVAMGVSVASIALPGLRSYTERARFEAALQAEITHATTAR